MVGLGKKEWFRHEPSLQKSSSSSLSWVVNHWICSGMYTILHETDDSTTVNFSEYGKFLPGNGMQLVTVGAKHLRLHRPNPYALVPETDKQWNQTTRLECIIHVRLLAPVKSLAVARIPRMCCVPFEDFLWRSTRFECFKLLLKGNLKARDALYVSLPLLFTSGGAHLQGA